MSPLTSDMVRTDPLRRHIQRFLHFRCSLDVTKFKLQPLASNSDGTTSLTTLQLKFQGTQCNFRTEKVANYLPGFVVQRDGRPLALYRSIHY